MKKITLLFLIITVCSPAFAQWGEDDVDSDADWKDKMFFGGGLGASFGSSYDFVSVSPLVGYNITPKLAGGVQVQYRYTKYKNTVPSLSTNDYGFSPFLRYNIFPPFFLHVEYEYLSYVYALDVDGKKLRDSYNSFLAGGGFFQPIGRNAGFFVLALYNFSYEEPRPDRVSPYTDPLIIRAGVTAGF
jgi:hypothetical protein